MDFEEYEVVNVARTDGVVFVVNVEKTVEDIEENDC